MEKIVIKNKKGLELEMLGKIIIGVVILVLLIIIAIILKTKGVNAIEFIKNLLRFRG